MQNSGLNSGQSSGLNSGDNTKQNIWVKGSSRSGKSEFLVQKYLHYSKNFGQNFAEDCYENPVLVFAVDAAARKKMSDRLANSNTDSKAANFDENGKTFVAVTPLSFFQNEVLLFWPLLITKLNLSAQFPILLQIENEQELATNLWSDRFAHQLKKPGTSNMRLVRTILDLFLLSGFGNKPTEKIEEMLKFHIEPTIQFPELATEIALAISKWRDFCWSRGLLTYGIITELFGRHLLPDPRYQASLKARFQFLFMDDVDEYPAIACDLAAIMLSHGTTGIFTFNPNGSARFGLGADPEYWQEKIENICTTQALTKTSNPLVKSTWAMIQNLDLGLDLGLDMAFEINNFELDFIENSTENIDKTPMFLSLETRSRGSLLRSVAEVIATAIAKNEILPQDIAIIAPGLDNIASYALREILTKKNIPIICLSDQHPLSNSAPVRAILTLLTLIFANLKAANLQDDLQHLVTRDQVAEMLVSLNPSIDPVRASILGDRCFVPYSAELLPSQTYAEWYRLGYEATTGYEQIRAWILALRQSMSSPILLDQIINQAVKQFFGSQELSFDQIYSLQGLLEAAQNYQQIGSRLNWQQPEILVRFINLIRSEIVTANPQISNYSHSIILSTIYQYRLAHTQHRWQFWLDIGSDLWIEGSSTDLFGFPLFLQNWHGEILTTNTEIAINSQRLTRLLPDLIDRAEERIYLCYSELSTAGNDQNGELATLKNLSEKSG